MENLTIDQVIEVGLNAQNGDIDSMLTLGELYETGSDVIDTDLELAFKWYERAANLNNPDAIRKVIEAYLNGSGVQRSEEKVNEWLSKLIAIMTEQGIDEFSVVFQIKQPLQLTSFIRRQYIPFPSRFLK